MVRAVPGLRGSVARVKWTGTVCHGTRRTTTMSSVFGPHRGKERARGTQVERRRQGLGEVLGVEGRDKRRGWGGGKEIGKNFEFRLGPSGEGWGIDRHPSAGSRGRTENPERSRPRGERKEEGTEDIRRPGVYTTKRRWVSRKGRDGWRTWPLSLEWGLQGDVSRGGGPSGGSSVPTEVPRDGHVRCQDS